MRFHSLVRSLWLTAVVAGCHAEPKAMTREDAAVLQATLAEITPAIVAAHPAMKAELRKLERTIRRGTPAELLAVVDDVRATAGSTIDDALLLVLTQAETKARSNNTGRN